MVLIIVLNYNYVLNSVKLLVLSIIIIILNDEKILATKIDR